MRAKMPNDEAKPILQEPAQVGKAGAGDQSLCEAGQQHITIQPIEFNHKHRNLYGYLSLAATVLVLINYLMIQERSCHFSFVNGFKSFDLIQSFHMTALIVAILVFVLSYFNFAVAIYDFKLLYHTTTLLMYISAGLLIYSAVAITTAPCTSNVAGAFYQKLMQTITDSGPGASMPKNIFSAGDGIGITVFLFDITGACLLFWAARNFRRRS